MADKTIGDLPAANALYDTDLMVLEQNGEAKNMSGTVLKNYLKPYADAAEAASEAAESALAGVKDAINNIPEGAATPIVNDLTTGGASMALSAEMGKELKSEVDEVADDLAALTPEDIGAASETAAFLFRKSIPSGSDLNAIVEPGSYYVTSANASGVANMPAAYAIHLYVFLGESLNANNTSARVLQIATRSNPISTNGNILWYRVINPSDGYFGDWKTLATTDYAVPLDGSKAMTGNLTVEKSGQSEFCAKSTTANRIAKLVVYGDGIVRMGSVVDSSNYFGVDIVPNTTDVEQNLKFVSSITGVYKARNILHTGNKPSGSYTGNGDATQRIISTGGIGNVIAVWSAEWGYGVVFGVGAITANVNGAQYFTGGKAQFGVGRLTLNTDSEMFNANGVTYYYQVL